MVGLSDLIDPHTGERKYLNAEERAAFKHAVQYMKPQAKTYCQLIYYTGCRLSEALEANPNALDFSENWVRFRTLKQNPNKPDRYRIVELPEPYLASLQSEYRAQSKKGKREGNSRLWTFTTRTAQTYIKEAMQTAGITGKKATARGLRHSMGVMLALDKVPLNVIADILGHKDTKNTLIYLQIVGEERRGLIAKTW